MAAAAFFGVAVYSQAKVQVIQGASIKEKARASNRFVLTQKELPKRGQITSSDRKVLARDEGVYALHIVYSKVPKNPAFYLDLGDATGISGEEIREMGSRRKSAQWPPILTNEHRKKLEAVRTRWRADGISAVSTGQRLYPLGAAASAVVGLAGKSGAVNGIERFFAKQLAGQVGEATGLVDRTGAFLPTRMEQDLVPKVDGQDIELTIDTQVQVVAHNALKRAVEENGAESGIALVIDPKSGDILAMANWPTFDPRTNQGPNGKPADLNPNIMSRFEPGSTMKILTQAKAIEDGKIGPGWTMFCSGIGRIRQYKTTCESHGGRPGHGSVDMEKAIAESCNVSAATWAHEIGHEQFRKYVKDLGLLEPTQIELPSEIGGNLSNEPVAKIQELMCWGYGQSMGVTPLGLGTAFTALGNEGVWMKPRLVKSIGGKPTAIREGKAVFSVETTRQVMHNMEQVFNSDHGTGKSLRIPGYRLAGKTGTAQRMGRGPGHLANFVGFLPAEDPKAMVLVMIDRPSGGRYYGGQVAGPVFKEIALALIQKWGLRPSSGTSVGVNPQTASGDRR